MRFYILRALLVKEVHRHLANRGGLALAVLLVVAALMLSLFDPGASTVDGASLVGGVHRCLIEYPNDNEFIQRLKQCIPADLQAHVQFVQRPSALMDRLVNYEPGVGAIQVRLLEFDDHSVWKFTVWHPPGDPGAMAAYEKWFFHAARQVQHDLAEAELRRQGVAHAKLPRSTAKDDDLWAVRDSFAQLQERYDAQSNDPTMVLPSIEIERDGLGAKPLDLRSTVATGMVIFALYFTCVYLLPTLNCEERERGVLLAQALSPASPAEILTAKFLFYPVLGMVLAAILAGIYKPSVVSSLFFWLAMVSIASGFLGIGMTVATLAKTQRAAFMGSMCYLLSVSLVLIVCSLNGIPGIPWLAIEFHGPRIMHAAITQEVYREHWGHLAATATLAFGWIMVAAWLFRRRGWQ